MQPAVTRTMGCAEWTMLLVLSAIWGGSFVLVSVALRELPPLTLVALRIGLAALILDLALLVLGHRIPRAGRVWADFLGMGVLNNVLPFCLIVWGQTHIAAGLAAILNAATPLATVIVAHRLTPDERMTGGKLAGVLIGLCGVAVMVGPSLLTGLGSNVLAQLAVLGAAISYAFAGVFGRRFKRLGVPPLVTAAGQVSMSTALLLPLALTLDRPWTLPVPGVVTWGAVLGIAALGTALAYLLYFRILATAGATNLLLVTLLVPAWAILLGSPILGEALAPREMLGMALIGAGLAAIDGRLLARLRADGKPQVEPAVFQGRDI